MNSIKIVCVFAFIFINNNGNAQNKSFIQFSFIHENKQLILNDSTFILNDSTQLQLSELKFYVSKITFLKNKKVVFEEKNSFHLIDASNLFSQKIEIQAKINADEIVFYLGIDSVTNISGALGGDLDPTKGMYWAWQSGYINLKIEGKSTLCKTRNNQFQFHLGGYTQPNYCLETIALPITNTADISIQVDVKKIIEQLNLAQRNRIMSPTTEAVILSKQIATCFNTITK